MPHTDTRMADVHKIVQPPPNRHVSVLMDPLQPTPVHASLARYEKPAKDHASLKFPAFASERTPSVPSGLSSVAQPPHISYVQQYQPLALLSNPICYQHYQMQQKPVQMRTTSLPVVSNPLVHPLPEHTHQRYLLSSLPDMRLTGPLEADGVRCVLASAGAGANTGAGLATQATTSSPPSMASSVLALVPMHSQAGDAHVCTLPEAQAKPGAEGGARNQLPFMQELNSLRSGAMATSRVYDMFEWDDDVKRRKCAYRCIGRSPRE